MSAASESTTADDLSARSELRAAVGAVVWRGDAAELRIGLVRGHDDGWTFPTGRSGLGEHLLAAPLRVAEEQVGSLVRLGVPLNNAADLADADEHQATCHLWAAEHVGIASEESVATHETAWLAPDEARSRLGDSDLPILEAFLSAPRATRPTIALRHAKAKPRSSWVGNDADRPLTGRGRRQADEFAALVQAAYGTVRVVTSPWLRCVQSIEPYAALSGAKVEALDAIGEDAFEASPALARRDLRDLMDSDRGVIFCSHGNVMSDIVDVLLGGDERPWASLDAEFSKGEFVVVHRQNGTAHAVERHRV